MDNTCICCGRVIPEGGHVCLLCEGQEMQTFRKHIRTIGDELRTLDNAELASRLGRLFHLNESAQDALRRILDSEVIA